MAQHLSWWAGRNRKVQKRTQGHKGKARRAVRPEAAHTRQAPRGAGGGPGGNGRPGRGKGETKGGEEVAGAEEREGEGRVKAGTWAQRTVSFLSGSDLPDPNRSPEQVLCKLFSMGGTATEIALLLPGPRPPAWGQAAAAAVTRGQDPAGDTGCRAGCSALLREGPAVTAGPG